MNKYFPKNNEFSTSYIYINKFNKFSVKGIIKYRNKKIKNILNSITIKNPSFIFNKQPINLKNIIQHLIDCERNFIYLAFLILRYKNDEITSHININTNIQKFIISQRSIKSLKKELFSLYTSTYYFFENLSLQELMLSQLIKNKNFSVRAIAYILSLESINCIKIIKKT